MFKKWCALSEIHTTVSPGPKNVTVKISRMYSKRPCHSALLKFFLYNSYHFGPNFQPFSNVIFLWSFGMRWDGFFTFIWTYIGLLLYDKNFEILSRRLHTEQMFQVADLGETEHMLGRGILPPAHLTQEQCTTIPTIMFPGPKEVAAWVSRMYSKASVHSALQKRCPKRPFFELISDILLLWEYWMRQRNLNTLKWKYRHVCLCSIHFRILSQRLHVGQTLQIAQFGETQYMYRDFLCRHSID